MTLLIPSYLIGLLTFAAFVLLAFYSSVLWREGRGEYRLSWSQVLTLWMLRLGVAGLALIALAKPAQVRTQVEERLPVLPILVDESQSMGFPDARESPLVQSQPPERRSRYHSAQMVADKVQAALSRSHRVRIFTFSDALQLLKEVPHRSRDDLAPVSRGEIFDSHAEPTGGYSNLGDGLVEALQSLEGDKVSGLVLLSDGRQTGGRKLDRAGEQAATARVPVHAITFGSEFPLRDLRIDEVIAGAEASLGDVLTFHVKVTNQIGASLETELLLEEQPVAALPQQSVPRPLGSGQPGPLPNGRGTADGPTDDSAPYKTVSRRSVTLVRGQQTIAISTIPETEGLRRFRFTLPRQPDEVSVDNNVAEVSVNIVKRTLKVLLVAGQPTREFYYLVPALLRDPVVDLACYLQNADVDFTQQGNSTIERLPETVKEWSVYDVAILFDVDPNGISTQQLTGLENMVSNGGGLMVVAGRSHGLAKLVQVHAAKIRGLLPVEVDKNLHLDHDRVYDQPFKIIRTTLGKNHPVLMASTDATTNEQTWSSFQNLDFYWYHPTSALKPKSIVLLETQRGGVEAGAPLMAIHRYVDGAVFFAAVNDIWRWRFPAESYDYDRLWTRAIRYLGEARLLGTQQQVALSTDRRSYAPGEEVQVALRVLDPALMAQLADQKLHASVTSESKDTHMVPLTADANSEPLYRGTYRARRLGTMIVQTKHTPSDADSESKPLFDVQHGFQVRMQSLEEVDTSADLAAMKALAEQTGGKSLDYRTMNGLDELIASIPTEPQILRSTRVEELWDGQAFLLLFLVLVSSELSLRKWWGLL